MVLVQRYSEIFHLISRWGPFIFVGESGAGKSSLLKLMYLALRPTRGNISLFGSEIASTPRDDLPSGERWCGIPRVQVTQSLINI